MEVHLQVIFIDRVRSTREGYVLTRVCPSIILSVHTWWGRGTPGGGGGTPPQITDGVLDTPRSV